MLAVYKRELKAYFLSPIGYIFMGAFLLIAGIFFTMITLAQGNPNFASILSNLVFIFLLLVPILTMRLMSEDRSKKVDQLLLTSPLSLGGLVMGKFFAAVTVFAGTLVVIGVYPIIMSTLGVVNASEIISSLLAFFLLGCAFISVGLFVSSIVETQMVSAIVTFGALLALWLMDGLVSSLPTDSTSGIIFIGILILAFALLVYSTTKNIYASLGVLVILGVALGVTVAINTQLFIGIINKLLSQLSLITRFSEISLGVLTLGPIVYYISFAGIFVYLTVRMQEKRRWS